MIHARLLACAIAACLAVPACGTAKPPEGGSSPEEVVKLAQAAATAKDAGALIRLMEPAQRPLLCAGVVMMPKMLEMMKGMAAGMGAGEGEEAKKAAAEIDALIAELDALNKTYAIAAPAFDRTKKPDEKELAKLFEKVDAGAYLAAVFAVMEKHKGAIPGKGGSLFDELGKKMGGELTELKVEGDRATAKVAGSPAEFVRVDGRWYATSNMGKGDK